MYTPYTIDTLLELAPNDNTRYTQLDENACLYKTLDVEPDEFIFSVLGYSGQFYYDQKLKQFVQTPYSRIKISYTTINATTIGGFILTLPDGTTCYFGTSKDGSRVARDSLEQQAPVVYSQKSGYSIPPVSATIPSSINSWQLLDIVSPSGKSVDYYYTNYLSVDYGRGGESLDFPGTSGCSAATGTISTSYYEQMSNKQRLSRISTDNCNLWFVPSSQARIDALASEYALDSVVVRDHNENLIKAFVLYQGYFKSTDSSGISFRTITYGPPINDVSNERLRLDSIQEISGTGVNIPPYKFSYNTTYILPDRLSTNQDFWGYYNHAGNGQFLTPTVQSAGYTGANRTVDTNYAQACMLTQVTYPTGGNTQYSYESNTANSSSVNAILGGYTYSELVNKVFLFFNSPYEITTQTDASVTYVDTFSVGSVPAASYASFTLSGCSSYDNLSCPLSFSLVSITNPPYSVVLNAPSFNASLPQGQYQIKCVVRKGQDGSIPSFNVGITWQEYPINNGPANTIIGGLRLKRMINYDPIGNTTLVRTLQYKLFSDTTGSTSSGQLLNMPVHIYNIPCGDDGGGVSLTSGIAGGLPASVTRIASNSALPLSSSDGVIVRYTNIREFQDSNAVSLKTEYVFGVSSNAGDYPSGTNFPFPSDVQPDWEDLLMEKRQYINKANQQYALVDDQRNFYASYQPWENDTMGVKIAPLPTANTFIFAIYNNFSEWYVLDSTVHTTYPSDTTLNNSLTTSTKYLYDPLNFAISDERTVDSKGEVVEKKTSYPQDYSSSAGYNISTLIQNNMVENPIKQETDRNGMVFQGAVTTYYTNGLPQNIYHLETAQPLDTVTVNSGTVVPSSYVLRDVVNFNSSGNLSELVALNSYNKSYIWDYSNNYPICQVSNADTSNIAYTSFEADGSGNWTIPDTTRQRAAAITGNISYRLTGSNSITKTALLSSTTYIVSYWEDSSANTIKVNGGPDTAKITIGGWTYYERQVSSATSVTVSGTGIIDELRLYPKGSLMTTYTYAPLIGMTSQCDASGKITYYTYDGLGRVKLIKDQYGNILKRYDYEYQTSNQ